MATAINVREIELTPKGGDDSEDDEVKERESEVEASDDEGGTYVDLRRRHRRYKVGGES
jgi:hypothetical protein